MAWLPFQKDYYLLFIKLYVYQFSIDLPENWNPQPKTQILPQHYIHSQQPQHQQFIPPESSSSLWPEFSLERSFAQSPPPGFVFAPEASTTPSDNNAPADLRYIQSRSEPDDSLTRESEQVSFNIIVDCSK